MKANTKINVASYAQFLFNEFVKDQPLSLVEEAEEILCMDNSMPADMLEYSCVVRGLSEEVIKGEHRLSQYALFQEWLREIGRNPNDEETHKIRENYNLVMDWVRAQFKSDCEVLDRILVPNHDAQETELWGDTLDHKVENYLINYVEVMSPRQLYKAKDRIFHLRKEFKEGREGLNYKTYVKTMLLVLEQILLQCNSCQPLLEKFREMEFDLQSVNCSENIRVESTASVSIDIESAVDLHMAAERVSQWHNVSVREAMMMLQDRDLTVLEFLIDQDDEDYTDNVVIE
jgi:hypothetical protein